MPADLSGRPGTVVITGASTGLGAALAIGYAEPGRVLGLIARRPDLLQRLAEACRAKGAEVITAALDVRDGASVAAWLGMLDARHPIDLAIANAGVFAGIGSDGRLESGEDVRSLVGTNLEGAILTASAAAALMRSRRRGHIALVASLAARQPLADAPVYSASKAGLLAYGDALRERLMPEGIRVSIVLPGHIRTAQTARHHGAMPFIMPADKAAAIVKAGLDRGRDCIAFPAALVWLIALGRCLPWRLRSVIGRSLRFTVDAPE